MLNYFRFLTAICLACLTLIQPSLAHTPDQLPFLKINGLYVNFYNVGSTSLTNFDLPQDAATSPYLVNENLVMELEKNNLPFLPDELNHATITWDFGDVSPKAFGLSQTHHYAKIGSYLIIIKAHTPAAPNEQLLDTIRINIVAKKDFVLPVAHLRINGKAAANSYTDILKADFSRPVEFDASTSLAGSDPLISYIWDFGDGTSGSGKTTSHTYSGPFSAVAPVVRVVTRSGFIADSFAQVENTTLGQTPTPTSSTSPHLSPALYPALVSLSLVIALAALAIRKKNT